MKRLFPILAVAALVCSCGVLANLSRGNRDHIQTSVTFESNSIYQNVYEMIEGRFPWVEVDGNNISIRGGGQPLFVVNGVETGDIDWVSPSDVKSIEVLKDPKDLSLYGLRGGNGVIVITLK